MDSTWVHLVPTTEMYPEIYRSTDHCRVMRAGGEIACVHPRVHPICW